MRRLPLALALLLTQWGPPCTASERENEDEGEPGRSGGGEFKDIHEEIELANTCEACLAKGGGWCTSEQRCVEDDIAYCDAESLIGLAGFTNDCSADEEGRRPKARPWIDKGVLVSYSYENGTCCMGVGIVNRAYHVLEEYTVLLRDGSKEEVKMERWNKRKPVKKKDENSEYHNIEFRYFQPHELTVISGIRPKDVVQAHFAVKQKKASEDVLVKSRRTEEAVVINTTVPTVAVNFTSDHIVSILPRDFVVDPTADMTPPARFGHQEL
eukprot:CAMPEP_0179152732 /NCGR_PEP_ID=MMETSP0796-20121207/74231_1 /TAXON_ID=73915 /ORGANISM="Pyrodinium bahamense, Strain pbaha01" /LENGTH=268 /DNA_ID=CAMNT_0020853951 /DNA_START=1 /DNA_END=807 /DNA_ORIENTATION=-